MPDSTDNLLLTGAAHYHLGNYQQSVHCNDRCILLDPTLAEAHANLANSLQHLGHLSMAVLYYQVRRAAAAAPSSSWGALRLAQPLGCWQGADVVRHCFALVDAQRQKLLTAVLPGLCLAARLRQHVPAPLACHAAMPRCNTTPTNQLHKNVDTHPEALCVQTALRLHPQFADACNNLASVHVQLGDVHKAVGYYTAALKIDPTMTDVLQNLGDLLLAQVRCAVLDVRWSIQSLAWQLTSCCARFCDQPAC